MWLHGGELPGVVTALRAYPVENSRVRAATQPEPSGNLSSRRTGWARAPEPTMPKTAQTTDPTPRATRSERRLPDGLALQWGAARSRHLIICWERRANLLPAFTALACVLTGKRERPGRVRSFEPALFASYTTGCKRGVTRVLGWICGRLYGRFVPISSRKTCLFILDKIR